MRKVTVAALALGLAACATSDPPKVTVREPTTARAVSPYPADRLAPNARSDGAIFQGAAFRGLFEDRRARVVGDVITIQIQENLSAKRSTASSLDRSSAIDAKVGLVPFMAASSTGRLAAQANSANNFAGKGETGSDNTFTGTITVTVVEVLPNGNLAVSGEKQIGINQNVETLRFSGVVNPAFLLPGNVVSSTQVADARLEVRGNGDIASAQAAGWLQRFFMKFLPF